MNEVKTDHSFYRFIKKLERTRFSVELNGFAKMPVQFNRKKWVCTKRIPSRAPNHSFYRFIKKLERTRFFLLNWTGSPKRQLIAMNWNGAKKARQRARAHCAWPRPAPTCVRKNSRLRSAPGPVVVVVGVQPAVLSVPSFHLIIIIIMIFFFF